MNIWKMFWQQRKEISLCNGLKQTGAVATEPKQVEFKSVDKYPRNTPCVLFKI